MQLYSEIEHNVWAWNASTSRQEHVLPQRETCIIRLRSLEKRKDIRIENNQVDRWTIMKEYFPLAATLMDNFAKEIDGSLARASIIRLKPNGKVYRHMDDGAYYILRNRYHLVIKSSAGSLLSAGDEQVRMLEGELWWFDNNQHHAAENQSDEWRIHYIFDVLPNVHKHLAYNPIQDHFLK